MFRPFYLPGCLSTPDLRFTGTGAPASEGFGGLVVTRPSTTGRILSPDHLKGGPAGIYSSKFFREGRRSQSSAVSYRMAAVGLGLMVAAMVNVVILRCARLDLQSIQCFKQIGDCRRGSDAVVHSFTTWGGIACCQNTQIKPDLDYRFSDECWTYVIATYSVQEVH